MSKLLVLPEPCSTCPYRKDYPSGLWDASEYRKLPAFDNNTDFATFHCHHETATGNPTVCRGWMTVHAESVAVRLAMATGQVTPDEVYAEIKTPLFATGQAACDHGLAEIDEPSREARVAIDKLRRARRKRRSR